MCEPWQIMWGLAVLIFFACKVITWAEAGSPITWRALGYVVAWPGLDARTFILNPWEEDKPVEPPTEREVSFALAKMFVGLVIYFDWASWVPADRPYLVGWVGMIGIVMTLHFGLFHMLSCMWRFLGVNAEPLMNWPIMSSNLGDFWGKRWNTAFRNLTHRFLFRPILRNVGGQHISLAIVGSFLFSGLVHDLVISLPSGGGFGGPTIYFIVQGIGILLEWRLRKQGRLKSWRGRLYAFVFLIGPLTFLFHVPFVENIVVPFMKATGAIT